MTEVSESMKKRNLNCGVKTPAAVMLALAVSAAYGQTAPDAGKTLQEMAPRLEAPRPSPGISIEAPKSVETPAGGMQIKLTSVSIAGSTRFTEAELLAVIGDVAGQSYDLAGLRGLADRITAYYQAQGYPFARAYLPPQQLSDGKLRIEMVEGRYGQVRIQGDDDLVGTAQTFLAPLQPGQVIEGALLERAMLVLDDLPGFRVTPIIRPGQELGTGDLNVQLNSVKKFAGEVGVDNQGNRYTGMHRARLNLDANSPFMLGDQLTLRSLLTEEGMWFGNLGYSLPLGGSGLRGILGYAHTYYELGKDFSNLKANGTADTTTVGLSYPIIRSQQANLTVSGSYVHKELTNRKDAAGDRDDRSSDALQLTMSFDLRDNLGGGGVTYGAVSVTPGDLKLDSTLRANDTNARTEGNFNKLNLDLARVQAVTADLSLFGRLSSQWASKNLDSSERFGLGGPAGVRAYPVGEAYGDEGWLTQLEARYAFGAFVPYVFYDAGQIKTNAHPWSAGENKRHIAGSGFGARYNAGPWTMDATVAWRTNGGRPQSDTADRSAMGWVTVGYRF